MNKEIKGILFDSGKVLNGPSSGHWFISPNFFSFVDKEKFKAAGKKAVNEAFRKASEYIHQQSLIRNEQEELVHFLEFFRIFSKELPQLHLSEGAVKQLASDLVYNGEKYRFYEDALALIPQLSKTYRLAVVSDAWPSLHQVFKGAGMDVHFSSFIVSSEIGVAKPHELMYKKALEELQLAPDEVVFVDDNIRNCEGAAKLGIASILLCRSWTLYFYYKYYKKYNAAHNLYGVLDLSLK